MKPLTLRPPTVGSVVKKIVETYPELSGEQVIAVVRAAIETRGTGEFEAYEVVNEPRALELAREAALGRAI